MNKKQLVLILTAAAAMMSFCSCDSGDDTGNDVLYHANPNTESVQNVQETYPADKDYLSSAKELITQFFELKNNGKYSELCGLCSDRVNMVFEYNQMTDGEDIEITEPVFDDKNCEVIEDTDGTRLAVWCVSYDPPAEAATETDSGADDKETKPKKSDQTHCYFAVRYSDGEYTIDDICISLDKIKAKDYLEKKFNDFTDIQTTDLQLAAEILVRFYQDPPEEGVAGLTFNEKLADGTFTSGDNSEFVKNIELLLGKINVYGFGNAQTDSYISSLDTYKYTIEIKDGSIAGGSADYARGDMKCTKKFPE